MNPDDYIGKGSKYVANALADYCRNTPLSPEFYILQEFLRVELNRELIENQKKYQNDSAKQMRSLIKATLLLVLATLLVVLATLNS
jgi:valyl-tRNA synthetase